MDINIVNVEMIECITRFWETSFWLRVNVWRTPKLRQKMHHTRRKKWRHSIKSLAVSFFKLNILTTCTPESFDFNTFLLWLLLYAYCRISVIIGTHLGPLRLPPPPWRWKKIVQIFNVKIMLKFEHFWKRTPEMYHHVPLFSFLNTPLGVIKG